MNKNNKLEEIAADIAMRKIKKKFYKWLRKALIGMVSSTVILLVVIIIIIAAVVSKSKKSFNMDTDYTCFSPEVEQYRIMVQNECDTHGISDYVDVVLAIMQCETGGESSDPMNSSDKESNTQYGKNRGDIESVSYSIRCGVIEISNLIGLCGVTDLNDTTDLAIMYEAYELNSGYIQFAIDHGGYSPENAQEYIDTDAELIPRNPNFSINVAMYIALLTNQLKKFIYPLAIFTISRDYTDEEKSMVFQGVEGQIVMSSSEGEVTAIINNGDYKTLEVVYNEYWLVYHNVSDCSITVGDHLTQGKNLGKLSYSDDNDGYCLEFEMYKDGELVNPNDYLNVVTVEKQELDEQSIAEGESIADYAKVCIDNLEYEAGGSSAFGCDELGFIHNVFSTFSNYDEDDFDLPASSYDDLINSDYVTYKDDTPSEINPMIMYEGDVIIYMDSDGNYVGAGVYIGDKCVVHMSENGCVKDRYNFMQPAVLLRFLGRKSSDNDLTWPIPGYGRWCTDADGEFNPARCNPVTGRVEPHKGTDISAPTGTQVVAAASGIVIEANYNDSCGYHVIIDHENGMKTYYFHSSELQVSADQRVNAGDPIMLVGSTGQATGPHLHFGMTIDGEWVNAYDYTYANEP